MTQTQTIGNNSYNNTQIMNINQPTLVYAVAFELLKCVRDFKFSEEDISLKKPANFSKKLKFNNCRKYISIFNKNIGDYIVVDKILKKGELIKSEKVVKNIMSIFRNNADLDDEGNPVIGDGDDYLDKMFEELKGRITRDPRYLESNFDDVDVEDFVNGLLQYGGMECQILLNPNVN